MPGSYRTLYPPFFACTDPRFRQNMVPASLADRMRKRPPLGNRDPTFSKDRRDRRSVDYGGPWVRWGHDCDDRGYATEHRRFSERRHTLDTQGTPAQPVSSGREWG